MILRHTCKEAVDSNTESLASWNSTVISTQRTKSYCKKSILSLDSDILSLSRIIIVVKERGSIATLGSPALARETVNNSVFSRLSSSTMMMSKQDWVIPGVKLIVLATSSKSKPPRL